jgi:hypothetical protein
MVHHFWAAGNTGWIIAIVLVAVLPQLFVLGGLYAFFR